MGNQLQAQALPSPLDLLLSVDFELIGPASAPRSGLKAAPQNIPSAKLHRHRAPAH
jgi:hypothetical protein